MKTTKVRGWAVIDLTQRGMPRYQHTRELARRFAAVWNVNYRDRRYVVRRARLVVEGTDKR